MAKLYRGLLRGKQPSFRTDNLGRLLLMALANWQEALVVGLQRAGFPALRATHMNLLRHIDMDGTRITEIAERAGVTKQAVGQLVTVCKKLNLVTTVADPSDRRAKIVCFTEHGRSIILAQHTIFKQIDAEMTALLGAESYRNLRAALERLADWSTEGRPR